jgi:hypothetical protein
MEFMSVLYCLIIRLLSRIIEFAGFCAVFPNAAQIKLFGNLNIHSFQLLVEQIKTQLRKEKINKHQV